MKPLIVIYSPLLGDDSDSFRDAVEPLKTDYRILIIEHGGFSVLKVEMFSVNGLTKVSLKQLEKKLIGLMK